MKYLFFCGLVLVLLTAPGCDAINDSSSGVDFGDDYVVALEVPGPNDAPLDVTPHLAKDQVNATVQYGGGCRDHDFTLDGRQRGDTVEIWFVHEGNGDNCEAFLTESVSAPLPDNLPPEVGIVLLTPGGSRFDLR